MHTENEIKSEENFKKALLNRLDHIEENLIYLENQLRQVEQNGEYLKEMADKIYSKLLMGRGY